MSKTRTIPCPPAIRYRTPVASWSSGARKEAGRSRAGTACHDPIDRRRGPPVSGGFFRRITVGDVLNFLERKDVGSVGSDDHREPGGRGPPGRHQDPAVVVSS